MKITWEAADITAGRRARPLGCNETWMVGYDNSSLSPEKKLVLVSLNDGCIAHRNMTAADVARLLNDAHSYPVELLDEKGNLKLSGRMS